MSEPGDKMSLRDEDLVAFLDNEMAPEERAAVEQAAATDAEVAARLAAIQGQPGALRDAFAPVLLEAPTARLGHMLDSLVVDGSGLRARGMGKSWTRRQVLAASVALVVAGGLADHAVVSLSSVLAPQDSGHWRDVVASYARLYTPETLSGIPDDPPLRAHELAEVGSIVGLQLNPKTISLPGLVLKRSQSLQYDTVPLAEINYLDAKGRPLALCIVPSHQVPKGPQLEIRRGLNVAFWNDGHHGFMVIGRQSSTDLADIAHTLAGRINTTAL
jgi:anti-sigma factor RsiW